MYSISEITGVQQPQCSGAHWQWKYKKQRMLVVGMSAMRLICTQVNSGDH
jgi:hypothetical protein